MRESPPHRVCLLATPGYTQFVVCTWRRLQYTLFREVVASDKPPALVRFGAMPRNAHTLVRRLPK